MDLTNLKELHPGGTQWGARAATTSLVNRYMRTCLPSMCSFKLLHGGVHKAPSNTDQAGHYQIKGIAKDAQGRALTTGLAKAPPKWRASRDRNELHYSREDPIEHTLFFGKDWTPYSGYEGVARLREKRRMRMDKWMAEKAARTSSAGGRSFDRHDARDDRRYLPYPDAWSGKTQTPRHLPYPDARPGSRYADAPRSSTHYREEEAPPGGYAHPRSDLHSQAREHAREHADARGSAFSPDARI